jgi:hypothetical protein
MLSDGSHRVETMKVQLALLADTAIFPYHIGVGVSGANLQLRGYVPNDMIRQRALELARRATFLNVTDGLTIQKNLSKRPPLRSVEILQKESVELLVNNFGETGRQMHVEARPNGLILVTGSVDSIEDKLAVSKLFRQLSGCFGVVNKLNVQPMVRDGQRVVQVTKDGTVTAAPSSLGSEGEHVLATPAAPQRKPVVAAPKAVAPRSFDAQDDELRLPAIVPSKPQSSRFASTDKKSPSDEAVNPPAPVMKWGQSAMSWESESKEKKTAADADAKVPVVKSATFTRDTEEEEKPTTKPADKADAAKVPVVKSATFTRDTEPAVKPAKKSKPDSFASAQPSDSSDNGSTFASSAALTTPPTPRRWKKRPDASEESEPPATAPAKPPVPLPTPAPVARPATAERAMPPVAPLDRPYRWPPAYDIRSPEPANGHPGTITFEDDEPASKPSAAKAVVHRPRPVVPENLKQQVKAVCGRQARDVFVEMRRDGSVLVTVKATSVSAGEKLTSKVLSIPEMASPNVHLKMDVAP